MRFWVWVWGRGGEGRGGEGPLEGFLYGLVKVPL